MEFEGGRIPGGRVVEKGIHAKLLRNESRGGHKPGKEGGRQKRRKGWGSISSGGNVKGERVGEVVRGVENLREKIATRWKTGTVAV